MQACQQTIHTILLWKPLGRHFDLFLFLHQVFRTHQQPPQTALSCSKASSLCDCYTAALAYKDPNPKTTTSRHRTDFCQTKKNSQSPPITHRPLHLSTPPNKPFKTQPWKSSTMSPMNKQSNYSSSNRGEDVAPQVNVLASCYIVGTAAQLKGLHYCTTGVTGKDHCQPHLTHVIDY